MSISIRNEEIERLLAEIKAKTGRGTADLLLDLLRRERERLNVERERQIAEGLESAQRLRDGLSARPLVDPRPVEEVVTYDENGLPC